MKRQISLKNGEGYEAYVSLLRDTTHWIAKEYNVPLDSLKFTCGATGAIDAALSLFERGSTIATMPFEYFDLERLAKARGIVKVCQAQSANNYSNSIETFIQWIKETKPDGCYISLPNNPNGQEYSKEQIREIFAAMSGKIAIIDQSLLTSRTIPLRWFITHRKQCRVFVVRSFSKSHGLVGDRIGLLFSYDEAGKFHTYAHAPSASSLRRLRRKWNSPYAKNRLALIQRNSTDIVKWGLLRHDLHISPSKSNCACIHFSNIKSEELSQYLRALGILVNSNQDLGLEGNFIRFTITTKPKSIRRLLSCIDKYLHEQLNVSQQDT